VLLLDISRVSGFADYFVIATADNPRQARALIDTLEKELRAGDAPHGRREGTAESGWVLIDYGAVIVHVFSPELRELYALEELWRAATQVVRIQ
jgi:ribosome-associated protein